MEGWQAGEKKAKDRRATRGEDNRRGTRSRSYRGGSCKGGERGDIG